MPMGALVGATIGAAVGAAAVYGYMSERRAVQVHTPSSPSAQAGSPVAHKALKYGMPIKERVRLFRGYVAGYDPATRNPLWVLEHLNRAKAYGDAKRAEAFFEDKVIPERFRSKLSDFQASGLDRGHMAPAMNHKTDQADMDETFVLTNICPQVGAGFNRDYWARFEKFAKDVVKRSDDVYIVTGPVFAPMPTPSGLRSAHGFIGRAPQAVAVPTHFYKVVLSERQGKEGAAPQLAVAAFVMPNRPIDPATPLTSFVVPLELLESVTGLEFFPAALTAGRRSAVDAAAVDWRKLGMAHRQALAAEGVKQSAESFGPDSLAIVPASKLPPASELAKTGVDSGPREFRPRKAGGWKGGDTVHLCEHVACRLPEERFWERGQLSKDSRVPRRIDP